MRPKTGILIAAGLVLVVATALWWRSTAERRVTDAARTMQNPSLAGNTASSTAASTAGTPSLTGSFALIATNSPNLPFTNAFAYRLTNTAQPLKELLRSDRAILLRNALIDTALGTPEIPEHLRAQGAPGAYIVQARGAITEQFRTDLQRMGAEIVSYVPNNAYLVRASEEIAKRLERSTMAQAVIPFEPYYKFDSRLLALAVNKELSPFPLLNVVAFPGTTSEAREALRHLGVAVVREPQSTAFGDILTVKADADKLPAIAQLSSIQMLGVRYEKSAANDLTRVLTRISTNRFAGDPALKPPLSHYPAPVPGGRLTGEGVLVAVADTGVDDQHPDLINRVFRGGALALQDFDGHGTHVIGTILGNGTASPLTTNAIGSFTNAVFSGMAPQAKAYVQDLYETDDVLQRNTALTNALISNNSWGFPGDNDYDIFAASYDAAVRDSLPGVTGEQQVAYVFAAGNEGGGSANGLSGIPGSVISPATGKNVITVGASDLPRYITNVVTRQGLATRPWFGMTDTNNEVSPYSSRGNVGIGFEGVFGRFKPDVVAPGSMLVSARSKEYVDPEGSTNTFVFQYNGQVLPANQTNLYALTIPPNAISVTIAAFTNIFSPTNLALVIGADIDQLPGAGSKFGIDFVTLDPTTAPALRAGVLYYTVANTNHVPSAAFDLAVFLTITNDVGDYYTVLKEMNKSLLPNYRYEAGTSMAAPTVSGFLACIQEFLRENFALAKPSPALLKALLINGARSLSPNYNLQVNATVNHQGWGLVNMSNSVPSGFGQASNGPMRFVEQNVTNALPTGSAQKYTVTVPNQARSYPLRITLVWTDPPGNPVTGVKLVNDLNLAVYGDTTNAIDGTSSSYLWLGNSFPPASDFTEPILTGSTDPFAEPITNLAEVIEVTRDYVNNVENVFIRPPLARSYEIVVKGHRVNVNATSTHTNSLAQDYALVISSGNVASNNNVNLAITGPTLTNDPSARIAGLARATNATTAGLLNQRVGANNPLIVSTNGATNQWAFFTYTNVSDSTFKYVAILTFFAPELSLPRFREADIDLYIGRGQTGPDLFALDETLRSTAIAQSARSTTRLGTELLVFSNAQPNEVFYIGVKSEDQQAANFNIFAASSDKPFSGRDGSNNIVARALPLPAWIDDGSPDKPSGTNLLMIVYEPNVTVQRVYLTNSITHEQQGDLIGLLNHSDPSDGSSATVTLNNHRTWIGNQTVIYDDSDQDDLLGSAIPVIAPDGPGRLTDFIGQQAFGVWNFSISDNALFHTGRVDELTIVIQPASTNDDQAVNVTANIVEGGWLYAGFRVPADATNVEVCVTEINPVLPVEAYIRRDFLPTLTQFDKSDTNVPPMNGFCMNYGLNDGPPLSAGRYFVGVRNPGPGTVRVHLVVTIQRGLIPDRTAIAANDNLTSLIDDATTNSFLFVTNQGLVTSVEVDVRLHHPRIADIALHLVNPFGTRVLLAENRGRDTTNGYGVSISNVVITNFSARVLDTSWEERNGFGFGVGTIVSGWRVDSGDVDVSYADNTAGGGFYFASHSGTNALDLNGNNSGAVSTNVSTTVGKDYLLSFAFTKNRNSSPPKSCRLEINGALLTDITYAFANGPTNMNWVETNFLFRATNAVTKIGFVSTDPGNGGIFLDTIHLDEVQISTNSLLYATFTDNSLKALLPIKFAPPPFGDTNYVSTNKFISGFEGTNGTVWTNKTIFTNANLFTNGQSFDGWSVSTNSVYVRTNAEFSYSGTNFLLLRTGSVVRVLSNTVQGKEYVLQFATRVAPRRLIFSTGVDEDALALPFGSVDSHYFLSSNSVTLATNRAFVLRTNTPPMGTTWNQRDLPDSHWIGQNATSPPPGSAFYAFKTRFNLTGYKWTNASLSGRFQADGEPSVIRLNGTNAGTIAGNSYRTAFVPFTFTNLFLPGINTLEIIVPNAPTPTNNTAMGIQAYFAADAVKAPLLFSNVPPPLESAVGEVRLAGCYTNYFTALSDGWRMQSVTFVASSNNVLLQFTGITPGVWLDHVQIRETGRKYYQPEEPLTPLVGQPSYGVWNLEVWDSRLGAYVSDSSLISWRLNLNFVRTNPPFLRLVNGVQTPTLRIGTNSTRYFVYDVPCDYGTVSNWLESLILPNALDLYFNQNTFPLTGANGDFPLLLNTTNGTSNLDVGAAPLFRSGRYYLAVRNTNAVPVDFRMGARMLNFPPCLTPPGFIVGVGKASFGAGGFKIEWSASPADEFVIEYANDPAGPWTDIPGTVTSGDGSFSFIDDGILTGGLPPQRFYRLRRQ